MASYLSAEKEFNQLSLKDLLDARDQYHVHLMHKKNVVATALGRYRIRRSDPWSTKSDPFPTITHHRGARTLENSEVRPYSWPCVLVFVEKWADPADFGKKKHLERHDLVPPSLYLPDGRVVPVCVVEAPKAIKSDTEPAKLRFPTNNIGGGYPVIAQVQGAEHVASIGCLVTDGHNIYALTNRHVCGEPGETLYSRLDSRVTPIGVSSNRQLTRKPFQEVYAGWPGKDVFVNLDIGLIEVDDVTLWSSSVREIGEIGELADLSINNISLRLIGCPVRAFGCASGALAGEIHALFYRYKSVGGFEYVADFLIGQRTPRPGSRAKPAPFKTLHGDSGTLWMIDIPRDKSAPKSDPDPLPMPLALQWGGQLFSTGDGNSSRSFALATCLSTVCNLLEVDLVRDPGLEQPEYWGSVGHYSIAASVARAISSNSPKLQQLMNANRKIISYEDSLLATEDFVGQTTDDFVPLADVPDNVWKHGKQGFLRGHEGPNHFADMDQPRDSDGKTLLDLCKTPSNLDPAVWDAFYESVVDPLTEKKIAYEHRGLLPFRVRQIFEFMVKSVTKKKFTDFVCAAGVLTHYIGDACQPLHISMYHHGDPFDFILKDKVNPRTGNVTKVRHARAEKVHEVYETQMVSHKDNRPKILAGLKQTPRVKKNEKLIQTGQEAAEYTLKLMRDTIGTIDPKRMSVVLMEGKKNFKSIAARFYDEFGDDTITLMQNGTHTLAVLWESAWVLGNGEANVSNLGSIGENAAKNFFQDDTKIPSCYINEIAAEFAP